MKYRRRRKISDIGFKIKGTDMAKKKEINNADAWYKVETASGVKYTPFATTSSRYVAVGDGLTPPTPKQLADEMNKGMRDLHTCGLVVKEFLTNESMLAKTILPNGYYVYRDSMEDEFLIPFEVRTDVYIPVGGVANKVKEDIELFVKNEQVYRELGLIYKLGQLLYGLPGMGKTALVREVLKGKDQEAIIIFVEKDFPSDNFIIRLKESLKDRLKIFVFEELAVDLSEYFIGRLLTFLDGELSVDKSIIFATTNYPEKIPGNIVNRPSRFDKLYEFGPPETEERKLLFKHYLGKDITEEESEMSKGLSVADIKEASILVRINGFSLGKAVKQMKDRDALCKKAFSKSKDFIGFGGKWTSGESDDY